MFAASKPVPMSCAIPKWKGAHKLIKTPIYRRQYIFERLDDEGNMLLIVSCALEAPILEEYIKDAIAVPRVRGEGVFGSIVPRAEVYYTTDGANYVYSRKKAPTRTYPEHVRAIIPLLEEAVYSGDRDDVLPPSLGELDITGDICYDSSIAQGGSVGAHSDDEAHWPAVMIYSLGQSRFLRVINKETKATYNVEVSHNSIVVMLGETFQQKYTHQVDKLSKSEEVGTRLSLNIRYKPVGSPLKKARR